MEVSYVAHMGSDLSVVNAARVSFSKVSHELSARDEKLIRYLAEHKHTSCFEHQTVTLRLKVPLFIARQIQRHRTFSYNEVSRRYVDDTPEFFWPDKWRARADNVKQGSSDVDLADKYVEGDAYTVSEAARGACSQAIMAYNELLDNDVAPELARMILPQNLYTEFYMTGNLRNWAHLLKLRLDVHAQHEVQVVAAQARDILQPLFPLSVAALMEYA